MRCGAVVCVIVREGVSSQFLLLPVRFCLNSSHSDMQSTAQQSHCGNTI